MKPNPRQSGEIPGSLLFDCIYTTEELLLRLSWSDADYEAARRQGLQGRYFGSQCFHTGRQVDSFLRSMPKAIEAREGQAPSPCDPGINQAEADEVWAKAHGCCERCNEAAFTVTTSLELEPSGQKRFWPEPRAVAVCTRCSQQLGGA